MGEKGLEKRFQWTKVKNQYYSAIIANLVMVGHGCSLGWVSPAIPLLMSENSPLSSGPITNDQLSWIGSFGCIGSLLGSFVAGYMASVLGAKRTILLLALPTGCSWLFIYFGNSYEYILAARVGSGMAGGGVLTTILLYISEISNNDIRGTLGSLTQLARNVGIFLAYIMGATIDYEYVPCVVILIPIMFFLLFARLPDTPMYYLERNREKEAEASLMFYKDIQSDNIREKDAMAKEIQRLKQKVHDSQTDERLTFNEVFNRQALKGLLIAFALSCFNIATAVFVTITYASHIIQMTGIEIDAKYGSILFAVMQILGNVCTTQLTERVGRKFLLIVSLLGSAIGLMIFSGYFYLVDMGHDLRAYQLVPFISISFVVFIGTAGIITLAGVCAVENLTPKTRNIGLVLSVFSMNLFAFVSLKGFPQLVNVIQVQGCMLIFAGACLIGVLFVIFVVTETRGKSISVVAMR